MNHKRLRILLILSFIILIGILQDNLYAQEWAKVFGGEGLDNVYSIYQTEDQGYILAGTTKIIGKGNDDDVWVIKTDASGDILWQKVLGHNGDDGVYSIQQTSDKGYITVGKFYSYSNLQIDKLWIVKFDRDGNILWHKTYGGNSWDKGHFIRQTSDGGYIVSGETNSFGIGGDMYLLKLDENGEIIWEKAFGGTGKEYATSVQQTFNGYIVAGGTDSFGAGKEDIFILQLDVRGNILWQKTYGGSENDYANSIEQTSDGYIVAGGTDSFGAGKEDIFILKLGTNGDILWQKTYGGSENDYANSIEQTSNGYIVAGGTDSFGAGKEDIFILQLDASGNILWQKTYGGSENDYANSIEQTSDGDYIASGETNSFGVSGGDIWILKLKPDGEISSCGPAYDSSFTEMTSKAGVNITGIKGIDTSSTVTRPYPDPIITDSSVSPLDQCYERMPFYQLGVEILGSGRVTSEPSGIDCGNDCIEEFKKDTEIILTAIPDTGSIFGGWSGDCKDVGDNKTQIIMDANKTCKATFILESLPDAGPDTIIDGDNEVDIPDNTIDTSFEDINDAGEEAGIDTITRPDAGSYTSYTLVNEKDLLSGCGCSFVE